ncbi:hypothetical protein HRbin27_01061 [bacterium HR27]|nr:hypothetical protein HRbin27_01061 [bacterium HR27]
MGVYGSGRTLGQRERWLLARVDSGCQVVQGGTQRVQVAAWIGDTAVLFRWSVAFRPDRRSAGLRLEEARDTEVDQCDTSVLTKHDIGRLEVTEHDWVWSLGMQKLQNIQDLQSPFNQLWFRDGLSGAFEVLLEVYAIDEFQDKTAAAAFDEKVIDVRDRRVPQRSEEARLSFKGCLLEFCERRVIARAHDLHCTPPLDVREMFVSRQIDCAHAAMTEAAKDPIAASEYSFWRQIHLSARRCAVVSL